MIKVNDKEIENVYFNGTKLDHVYVNGVKVYESTVYVAKPTISGAYTFDTAEHKAVINNTNEAAYVISGVINASAAGTYTVKFTLNKGYAWDDETTDALELTWSIAKRTISVPSLNTTWLAWVEGEWRSVTVNGIDTAYVNQSGDTAQYNNSSNIGAQHAVTWSLKYPESTIWTDGSNGNKSQTWTVAWQAGTSHYAGDIFNDGWGFDNVQYGEYSQRGELKDNCIYVESNRAGYEILRTKSGTVRAGSIGHMIVKINHSSSSRLLIAPINPTTGTGTGDGESVDGIPQAVSSPTDWTEIAIKFTQSCVDNGRTALYLRGGGTAGCWVKRIWITY